MKFNPTTSEMLLKTTLVAHHVHNEPVSLFLQGVVSANFCYRRGGVCVHDLNAACRFRSGWILIDRSGKHFGSILCYLRDGTVGLPKGRQAVQELLAEAKYYLIQGLVELCQNGLQVGRVRTGCYLKYA